MGAIVSGVVVAVAASLGFFYTQSVSGVPSQALPKRDACCHVCTIQTDVTQLNQLHGILLEIRQSDSTGNKEKGSWQLPLSNCPQKNHT